MYFHQILLKNMSYLEIYAIITIAVFSIWILLGILTKGYLILILLIANMALADSIIKSKSKFINCVLALLITAIEILLFSLFIFLHCVAFIWIKKGFMWLMSLIF